MVDTVLIDSFIALSFTALYMYMYSIHVQMVVDSFSPADRLSASEIHLLWQSWLEIVVVICSAVIPCMPCTCSAHPSCVTVHVHVYNYYTTIYIYM